MGDQARGQAKGQVGMDETIIEDEVVEKALEKRQTLKGRLSAVQADYDAADEEAKVALQRLELPEGAAARVGRFRIERRHYEGGWSKPFETKARDRMLIGIAKE